MLTESFDQPVIVDLGMSDIEYLQLLAQGKDPVKQQRDEVYELVLLRYGLPAGQARQVAPLLEQRPCSIEEKILVNQALKQVWLRLIGRTDT